MIDLSMFSLEGKKGFITGAAQGIGKCIAIAYAKAGADVAIVDMNYELAKSTAAEIAKETGRNIIALSCNVTQPSSVEAMMKNYMKAFGQIDFAVNNAGIFSADEAMDIEYDRFKSVIDVNLNGVFLTSQIAAREMKKNWWWIDY